MSGTEINVSYLHINSLPNWGMVTASKHHSKNNKNYLKTNKKRIHWLKVTKSEDEN